jgi:molybdopterin synthase catalytic subunit
MTAIDTTDASPSSTVRVELTRQRIRAKSLVEWVRTAEAGALITFDGCVRNHSHGRRTLYLEYEAYEVMALGKMREIAAQMSTKFAIDRVAMVHRLGRLEIGETSVFIAVSAAHRAPAFEACRFAIDTLKRTVPIWKKEYFADGAVWAEGEIPPAPIAAAGTASEANTTANCGSAQGAAPAAKRAS